MTFVSYAQNFEDVMLWRALKGVGVGFYIDIGAQDPVVDSVSLAFYERGWRGLHVEPTRQYSQRLQTARPDETVLQVAVGDALERTVFFEFFDTGLSTADEVVAKKHIDAGYACEETVVDVISLEKIFERAGDREIHWLKLDVEGFEKQVLESWGVSQALPWILVIESTKPLTQEQTHEEWESLVFKRGYQFSYFDGINRFYVSPRHADLKTAFLCPPNVFDDFALSGLASQPFCNEVAGRADRSESRARHAETLASHSVERAEQAERRAQQEELRALQAEACATEAEILAKLANDQVAMLVKVSEAAEARAQSAEQERDWWRSSANEWHDRLLEVHRSTSWVLTKPLRAIKKIYLGKGK